MHDGENNFMQNSKNEKPTCYDNDGSQTPSQHNIWVQIRVTRCEHRITKLTWYGHKAYHDQEHDQEKRKHKLPNQQENRKGSGHGRIFDSGERFNLIM